MKDDDDDNDDDDELIVSKVVNLWLCYTDVCSKCSALLSVCSSVCLKR
jgi:hypothetical protein